MPRAPDPGGTAICGDRRGTRLTRPIAKLDEIIWGYRHKPHRTAPASHNLAGGLSVGFVFRVR